MSTRNEIVMLFLEIEQVGEQVESTVLICLQEKCRVTHSVVHQSMYMYRCLWVLSIS